MKKDMDKIGIVKLSKKRKKITNFIQKKEKKKKKSLYNVQNRNRIARCVGRAKERKDSLWKVAKL